MLALYGDRSTVQLDDRSADGEAEAGAGCGLSGPGCPEERIEELLLVGLRNSDPIIDDCKYPSIPVVTRCHLDVSAAV